MFATPLEIDEEARSRGATLVYTEPFDLNKTQRVQGYDFDQGINYQALLESFKTTGFQATNFAKAVDEINDMITWRLSDDEPTPNESTEYLDPIVRQKTRTTIFFGFTSNMVSCGNRDIIRYLCKHKMVDVLVTTAGGVEEDFMKVLAPHYLAPLKGPISGDGALLRRQGMNRIGNLLVPNDNYCNFESWIMPIFSKMHAEQLSQNIVWTPSLMIDRLGLEINNPESIYYWCHRNAIPVFCPAITDGSLGDMLTMFAFQVPDLICDVVQDSKKLNTLALNARKIGQIILGGGVPKHHIFNACLFGNGASKSVVISTAPEYDGSDSGAPLDEAKSWGKIKADACPVKVIGDASIIFPLLTASTFAKHHEINKQCSSMVDAIM